jgi:hypothetical protein
VVDLVGVRDATIRAFSRRSVEIADGSAQLGATGARVAQLVGDRTRGPKDLATAWPELVEGWWHTAERTGLTATAVRSFGQRTWSVSPPDGDRGPGGDPERLVTEFDRPFTRRELATVVADRAIPGVPVARIEQHVEALLSAPTLQSRPPSRFAGAPGARRFPRPAPELRWTTPAIGVRMDRVADAITTAPSIDPDLLARRGITGTIRHRSVGGDRSALGAVHLAAEQMIDRGGRVVGLASTSAISGHLEAITGVTTSSDVPKFDRRSTLLVVYGARSVPTSVLDDSLTAADRSGATVLFVERTDPERSKAVILTEEPTVRADRPGAHRAVFGSVTMPRDIPELLEQIGEASARWRAEGRTPVVVAVDGLDGLGALGIPVLGPRAAAEQARARPDLAAIVLGDARVLAAGAARAFGSARSHLGVRPVDRDHVVARSLDDIDRNMRLAMRGRSRGRSLDR